MTTSETQFDEAFKEAISAAEGVKPIDFTPVTDFSTHFAEHTFKDSDLLVHVFPRAGESDRYYPAEIRDGNYIPGRFEEKATVTFPGNVRDLIKQASDKAWMGDVAIDLVPELGAYAVQFQGAKNTVKGVGTGKFVDTFCAELDALLE